MKFIYYESRAGANDFMNDLELQLLYSIEKSIAMTADCRKKN